jgi:hypothetical protein
MLLIKLLRLETVLITEGYFGATAVPLLGIGPYYLDGFIPRKISR